MKSSSTQTFQHWRASWRETGLLLREFGLPLLFFFSAVIGGGILYHTIAKGLGEPLETVPESIYLVLTMAFLQPNGDFPNSIFLQLFYFIMPLVGLGALAQGLTDFGILLFNRRARSREWEIAVASTLKNHHILVGLGHLGFRVAQQLRDMGESVAVIELDPKADLFAAAQKMNIPVIAGDASREITLLDAGIKKAKSLILCVQDDELNLKTALKSRSLNPNVKIIIRIFDDEFADELQNQFGFNALSGTAMAAPAFAAAAAGADITNPINVEGESLSLARLAIMPGSKLDGKTVGQVEDGFGVSVVMVRQDHTNQFHPADSILLRGQYTLAVLGRPENLNKVVNASR
ncbi:MAG: Glutathione-regulated potassium-efflux system protein KefC [Anaerolineales bacterium]|nr:Glutathione-regulated potassium-efflux system protein KefC [Anaerolineales bacterium]